MYEWMNVWMYAVYVWMFSERMYLWMYVCMNEWMNVCMNLWMYECMTVWMNEWMNECMTVWMNECMYECMNVWMYVWMYEYMNVWMYEWMNVCIYYCLRFSKSSLSIENITQARYPLDARYHCFGKVQICRHFGLLGTHPNMRLIDLWRRRHGWPENWK